MFDKKLKEEVKRIDENLKTLTSSFNNSVKKANDYVDNEIEYKKKLERDISNKLEDIRREINNKVDDKLLKFHKEISVKYFQSINDIFKWNKEISLIGKLSGQITDKESAKLRESLLEPSLREKWDEEEKAKGNKIVNKGQEVIKKRKALWERMLDMEKQGKDIVNINEQIKAYDDILEMIK